MKHPRARRGWVWCAFFQLRRPSVRAIVSAMKAGTPGSRRLALLLHLALLALAAWHVAVVVSMYLANQFYIHDVGQENYWLYYTWHGRFFWSIVHECPHFAKHFTPTYVLLVPLHALVNHVLLPPILQCLAVMSGAWAVAWMTDGFLRRGRSVGSLSPLGLTVGLFYVGNIYVGAVLLSCHFESFPMALSLWALAALANARKRLFWVFLVLAVGFKEDMALYWAAFGAWWIFFGWDKKGRTVWGKRSPGAAWVLLRRYAGTVRARLPFGAAVAAFGIAWLILAILTMRWVSSHFGGASHEIEDRYGWLGASPGEWVDKCIQRPGVLWPPLWFLIRWFLLLVLYLPFLAPSTLLLLVFPGYVMGLSDFRSMRLLQFYYSYPLLPFLFLGVALGVVRLARFGRRFRLKRLWRAGLGALLVVAGCWMLHMPTVADMQRRSLAPVMERHGWIRKTLRETVPPDASVAAQFDLLCQLPFRREMYPLFDHNLDRAEYWVLDRGGLMGDMKEEEYQRIQDKAKELAKEGKAEILVDKHGLLIVRRLPRHKTR